MSHLTCDYLPHPHVPHLCLIVLPACIYTPCLPCSLPVCYLHCMLHTSLFLVSSDFYIVFWLLPSAWTFENLFTDLRPLPGIFFTLTLPRVSVPQPCWKIKTFLHITLYPVHCLVCPDTFWSLILFWNSSFKLDKQKKTETVLGVFLPSHLIWLNSMLNYYFFMNLYSQLSHNSIIQLPCPPLLFPVVPKFLILVHQRQDSGVEPGPGLVCTGRKLISDCPWWLKHDDPFICG